MGFWDFLKNEELQELNTQQTNSVLATEEHVYEKLPHGIVAIDKENGIVTTQEEIDAYNIIRSILRRRISADKIIYQDNKSYFVIAIENSYWWICRLSLKPYSKRIGFPSEDRKSCEWVQIESLDDIFKYADRLEQSLYAAKSSLEQYRSKHYK